MFFLLTGMGILSLKPHAMVNYVEPKVAPPRVSSWF